MTTKKLLRVEAPHFVAGAIYQKEADSTWRCIEAAPILYYLLKISSSDALRYIKKKKYKYQLINIR